MLENMPNLAMKQEFKAPAPVEMGSAPVVLVRTIEQTRKDQAWEAEEMARKLQRKREVAADRILAHADGSAIIPIDQLAAIYDFAMPVLVDRGVAESITLESVLQATEEYDDQPTSMIGIDALPPQVPVSERDQLEADEQAKYEKMWGFEQYRVVAPGEGIAPRFIQIAKPKAGSEVIDFGAGTGRGALMLAIMGMKVRMVDFAENCLDEDVRNALTTQAHVLDFTQHDLNKPLPFTAEYGMCTDVLEHIPPQFMARVVSNILHASQHVFFQISCEDDHCGALIGRPLHLSVHPYKWWHEFFTSLGAVIHWSEDQTHSCLFYVSAWIQGKDMVDAGVLNTTMEKVRENVAHNIQGGWQQVSPHETNDLELMILGSGPSLNDSEGEIRRLQAQGVKIITLNGAYNWCVDNGIRPVNQVVVDARPFNARFTHDPRDNDGDRGDRFFIASQCDPSVFEGLPKDRTWMWHTTAETIKDVLNEHLPIWWGIPGGSTVLLRAIPMFRMLGYRKFHLFGCDSCMMDGVHHSISQPENDSPHIMPVIMGGKKFVCQPDQYSQAQEFMDLIRVFGNEIELEIYGNGLLAEILKTGAEMAGESLTPTASEQFVL